MEHISIAHKRISYPVGVNFNDNINSIKGLFVEFKSKVDIKSLGDIYIIGRGNSCAIIGSLFAEMIMEIGNMVYLLSKEDDYIYLPADKYTLFVDDLIEYGQTINKVVSSIRSLRGFENFKFSAVCVGGKLSSEVYNRLVRNNVCEKIYCSIDNYPNPY